MQLHINWSWFWEMKSFANLSIIQFWLLFSQCIIYQILFCQKICHGWLQVQINVTHVYFLGYYIRMHDRLAVSFLVSDNWIYCKCLYLYLLCCINRCSLLLLSSSEHYERTQRKVGYVTTGRHSVWQCKSQMKEWDFVGKACQMEGWSHREDLGEVSERRK